MKTMKYMATLAVALALPALAGAQCSDPNNLLTADNCGFDTAASVGSGLGSWDVTPVNPPIQTLLTGTAAHSATGGRTSPGSMLMTTEDNGGNLHISGIEVCVPGTVPAGTSVGFGLHANTSALIELGYLHLVPTNSDCSASVGSAVTVDVGLSPPTPGSYGKLNAADATLTVPANTEGLKIELLVASFTAPFTMNIDDAYVGENMVPVELMHFSVN